MMKRSKKRSDQIRLPDQNFHVMMRPSTEDVVMCVRAPVQLCSFTSLRKGCEGL